jgi:hypothetical protein
MKYQRKTKPALWVAAYPKQAAALRPERAEAKKAGKRPFRPQKRRLGPAKHGARRPKTRAQTFLAEEKKLYRQEARQFVAASNELGQFCQVEWVLNGRVVPVEEIHHMRGRGYGGRGPLLRDQRFWLAVSRAGHNWIHQNQNKAREYGWLCQLGEWNVAS